MLRIYFRHWAQEWQKPRDTGQPEQHVSFQQWFCPLRNYFKTLQQSTTLCTICKKTVLTNGGNNKHVFTTSGKNTPWNNFFADFYISRLWRHAIRRYKQLVMCDPKVSKWFNWVTLQHLLVALHMIGRSNIGWNPLKVWTPRVKSVSSGSSRGLWVQ